MSSEDTESPQALAEDIRSRFAEEYADYDLDEIAEKVEQFQDIPGIDDNEITRAVTTSIKDDLGVSRDELLGDNGGGGGTGEVSVADATELADDEWIDLTVRAVEADEVPQSDAIGQGGIIGDETGAIDFVSWEKSDVDELEEGKVYTIESAVTGTYQGNRNIKLNSQTDITEVDEDIAVDPDDVDAVSGDTTVEATGALVDLQSGSGLIERCPEDEDDGDGQCGRPLRNGQCQEHGDVEGEHDIRLKAVLDDGDTAHEVIVDAELTEEVTGITKDEAIEMAMDALDMEVVGDAMAERVIGRYYSVEGPKFGRYVLADEMELVDEVSYDGELLEKARSMQA